MKPANLRELLTAAIDGELTPAERKTAHACCDSQRPRSPVCSAQDGCGSIEKVARVPAPADLADNVLNVIRERGVTPTPLPPMRRPTTKYNWPNLPLWINLATAAAVLIVISIGSYTYFTASHDYYARRDRDQASNDRRLHLPADNGGTDQARWRRDRRRRWLSRAQGPLHVRQGRLCRNWGRFRGK